MKKTVLFLLGILLIASCNITLEKRIYTKGYFIQFSRNDVLLRKNVIDSVKQSDPYEINKTCYPEVGLIERKAIEINTKSNKKEIAPVSLTILPLDCSSQSYFKEGKLFNKFRSNSSEQDEIKLDKALKNRDKKSDINTDTFLYFLALFMGFVVYGMFKMKTHSSLKAMKWADRNKLKTRIAIALLQVGLFTLGLITGISLRELGYAVSDTLQYIFSGILILAFINSIFNEAREKLLLFDTFHLKKLGHLIIGISIFMITISIGNRTNTYINQSSAPITVLEQINNSVYQAPPLIAKRDTDIYGDGWLILLYVLLALLLLAGLFILTCAAWCSTGATLGLPTTILSILIMILVINGMVRSVKNRKYKSSNPTN